MLFYVCGPGGPGSPSAACCTLCFVNNNSNDINVIIERRPANVFFTKPKSEATSNELHRCA